MPSQAQQSVICAICHDQLLRGFDDLGHAHAVVRLNSCGHMLHRTCAKTWYASKADKRWIPVCPCCSAPIDERPENLKVCYFSGDNDEDSPVEPVPPQEILMALTPATKPILELLAMLHELRPRLGVVDKHAYDNMVDQLRLDAGPMGREPEPSMIREIREKLDKIVEKVTEMWAVEETKKHLEAMMDSFGKWKYIAHNFTRTRKNQTEFKRINEARIDQKKQLKALSDKLKKQEKESHWQQVQALEDEKKSHQEQLAMTKAALEEELRLINAKWRERNRSLQAQLDQARKEVEDGKLHASVQQKETKHVKRTLYETRLELAMSEKKCQVWESRARQWRSSGPTRNLRDHPSVALNDGISDSGSEREVRGTLEISDGEGEEDEDSFVIHPYNGDPAPIRSVMRADRLTEPTKREIKVKPDWRSRKTNRGSRSLSVSTEVTEMNETESTFLGYHRASQGWSEAGRGNTVSCSSLQFEGIFEEPARQSTPKIDAAIDPDDPFISSQPPIAGPSVPLASGPRYQGTGFIVPPSRPKKRSLEDFLAGSEPGQRAHGEKRRIRAVPPKRQQ